MSDQFAINAIARLTRVPDLEMIRSMSVSIPYQRTIDAYISRINYHVEKYGLAIGVSTGTCGRVRTPLTTGMLTFEYRTKFGKTETIYLPHGCFDAISSFMVGQNVYIHTVVDERMFDDRDARKQAVLFNYKILNNELGIGSKGEVTAVFADTGMVAVRFKPRLIIELPQQCLKRIEKINRKKKKRTAKSA